MADRPGSSARLVTYLWFLTTAFSLVAMVIRYRRLGEVAWYLVAAAAFAFIFSWTEFLFAFLLGVRIPAWPAGSRAAIARSAAPRSGASRRLAMLAQSHPRR